MKKRIKKLSAILLTAIFLLSAVSVISANGEMTLAGVNDELVSNGSFEESADGITPNGFGATGGYGGAYATLQSDQVHTGNYAVKLSGNEGNHVYVALRTANMIPGAKYEISCWYKGFLNSGAGFGFQIDTQDANGKLSQRFGSPSCTVGTEWKKLTAQYTMPQNAYATQFYLGIYPCHGTIYMDDVSLKMIEAPDICILDTDQVFYYSEKQTGHVTLTLDKYYVGNYEANIKLCDGEEVLDSSGKKAFADGQIKYDFSLSYLTQKKKEYSVIAEIYKDGEFFTKQVQPVYKYDRPKALNKNGEFIKNGKPIQPGMAFQVPTTYYAKTNKLDEAGINIVLWSPYATKEQNIEALDRMEENGVMAAVVCFWDMIPAGNPVNIERVAECIRGIKDHPAIFCYMVADEPYSHDTTENVTRDMRNSYKMLRDIDDVHPVSVAQDVVSLYRECGKYVDIMMIDPYPGNGQDYGRHVGNMNLLACEAVNYEKPIYNILQAFTFVTKPTDNEIRHMIYQSFMAGSQGLSWYSISPDNPHVDKYLDKTTYWNEMKSFKEKEQDIVYKHYSSGKEPSFSKYMGNDEWYESWADGDDIYLAVINRENSARNVNIPLSSTNGAVSLGKCAVEVVNGTDISKVTNNIGSLTVNMEAHQAVLLKLTPEKAPDYSMADNLLKNGNFENMTDTQLSDWGLVDHEQSHNFSKTGGVDNSGYAYSRNGGARIEQTIPTLKADTAYLLEMDFKAKANSAWICFEPAENWTNLADFTLPEASSWTHIKRVVKLRKSDTAGWGVFRVWNLNGNKVCVDNIKITEIDNYDKTNLALNGGFEEDDNLMNFMATGGTPEIVSSCTPSGEASSVSARAGKNMLRLKSGSGVYFDARIDNNSTQSGWYNFDKLSYTLSFDAYINKSGTAPSVKVESYSKSNEKTQKTYTIPTDKCSAWQRVSITLDDVTSGLTAFFRIYLQSGGREMLVDNVVVTPNNKNTLEFLSNGKPLSELDTEMSNISARAVYKDSVDSYLILALYNNDVYGNLRLADVSFKRLAKGATADYAHIENAEIESGSVLRAYIWDKNHAPKLYKEISY